jgi:hypothetical protein
MYLGLNKLHEFDKNQTAILFESKIDSTFLN